MKQANQRRSSEGKSRGLRLIVFLCLLAFSVRSSAICPFDKLMKEEGLAFSKLTALLPDVRAGNDRATAAFVNLITAVALKTIYGPAKTQDRDDIAQESALHALHLLASAPKEPVAFRDWLIGIINVESKVFFRKRYEEHRGIASEGHRHPFSSRTASRWNAETDEVSETPHDALIARVLAKDKQSIEDFYALVYRVALQRISRKIKGAAVEDVAQEVTLAALKTISNFRREKGFFEQWISGIIKHKLADYFRSDYRQKRVLSLDDARDEKAGSARDVPEKLEKEEKQAVLAAWLEQALPLLRQVADDSARAAPFERAIFSRHLQGLSHAEIATQLGAAPSETASVIFAGRKQWVHLLKINGLLPKATLKIRKADIPSRGLLPDVALNDVTHRWEKLFSLKPATKQAPAFVLPSDKAAMMRAIRRLPAKARSLLRSWLAGSSYAEIKEELKLNGKVGPALSKAQDTLQRSLQAGTPLPLPELRPQLPPEVAARTQELRRAAKRLLLHRRNDPVAREVAYLYLSGISLQSISLRLALSEQERNQIVKGINDELTTSMHKEGQAVLPLLGGGLYRFLDPAEAPPERETGSQRSFSWRVHAPERFLAAQDPAVESDLRADQERVFSAVQKLSQTEQNFVQWYLSGATTKERAKRFSLSREALPAELHRIRLRIQRKIASSESDAAAEQPLAWAKQHLKHLLPHFIGDTDRLLRAMAPALSDRHREIVALAAEKNSYAQIAEQTKSTEAQSRNGFYRGVEAVARVVRERGLAPLPAAIAPPPAFKDLELTDSFLRTQIVQQKAGVTLAMVWEAIRGHVAELPATPENDLRGITSDFLAGKDIQEIARVRHLPRRAVYLRYRDARRSIHRKLAYQGWLAFRSPPKQKTPLDWLGSYFEETAPGKPFDQNLQATRGALASLAADQQSLVSSLLDGQSYETVADASGLTVKRVRDLFYRFVKRQVAKAP